MSYEKTTWTAGDKVTAAKLNKIENGIASAGVFIITDTDGVLNASYNDVAEAVDAGKVAMIKSIEDNEISIFYIINLIPDSFQIHTTGYASYSASSSTAPLTYSAPKGGSNSSEER